MRRALATAARAQRGIALIIVLWLTVLLTVIGERLRVLDAQRGARRAQRAVARAGARGGRRRGRAHGVRAVAAARSPNAWARRRPAAHAGATATSRSPRRRVDETARSTSTSAPEALLKGLLQQRRRARRGDGAAHRRRDRSTGAIRTSCAARTAPRRPTIARPARSTRRPTRRSKRVGELSRVLGVTPALMARVAPTPHRHSRQPGINAATAPRDVLLALPDATPELVDAYIAARDEALGERACRCRRSRRRRASPPAPVRCGASASQATAPDGVTFAREAVVRPSRDPRRPLATLSFGRRATPADPRPRLAPPRHRAHLHSETDGPGKPVTCRQRVARCASRRARARRLLALVDGASSRRWCPRRRAPRSRRRRMRPVLAFEADDGGAVGAGHARTAGSYMEAAPRSRLSGDASDRRGGPRRDRRARRRRRADASPPRVVVALPAAPGAAQDDRRCPPRSRRTWRRRSRYDLDRHTPFKPDELYFDAAIVGRDAASEARSASIWPRRGEPVVDQALQARRGWGAAGGRRRARRRQRRRRAIARSTCCRSASARTRRVAPLAVLGADRAARRGDRARRHRAAVWQKREYAIALHAARPTRRARRPRVRSAARRARAAHRRLQLRARAQVRVSERACRCSTT